MVYNGKLSVYLNEGQVRALEEICDRYDKSETEVFRDGIEILKLMDETFKDGNRISVINPKSQSYELVLESLSPYVVKGLSGLPLAQQAKVGLILKGMHRAELERIRAENKTSFNEVLKGALSSVQLVSVAYDHRLAIVAEKREYHAPIVNLAIVKGYGMPPVYNPQ